MRVGDVIEPAALYNSIKFSVNKLPYFLDLKSIANDIIVRCMS